MAQPLIWLSLSRSDDSVYLEQTSDIWRDLRLNVADTPSLIVLYGRKMKTRYLNALLKRSKASGKTHGQVHLSRDGCASNIFVDVELDVVTRDRTLRTLGPTKQEKLQWMSGRPHRIGSLLVSRSLSCFADVVVYFAADVRGLSGVAELLAEQIMNPGTDLTDLPQPSLPQIIVIHETTSANHDEQQIQSRLELYLKDYLSTHYNYDVPSIPVLLESKLGKVSVLPFRPHEHGEFKANVLRDELRKAQGRLTREKISHGLRFARDHLYSLLEQSITHFARRFAEPFSFAKASRAMGFSTRLSTYSVERFLDLVRPLQPESRDYRTGHDLSTVPENQFQCELLASTVMLACYPTGSHLFSMPWLYKELFEMPFHQALLQKLHTTEQVVFQQDLESRVIEFYDAIREGRYLDGKQLHADTLKRVQNVLRPLRTNAVCLSCLINTPERLMSCGHSLCETCVRIWSSPMTDQPHSYDLGECPLCGTRVAHVFRLLPPTAGIRLLSLDGGGVKGVIPLIVLDDLENRLKHFGVPLRDFFDFVCGTSAGGLIALGLFVMEWSASDCLRMFKALAQKTFRSSGTTPSYLGRLQQLVLSYLRDYRYSAVPIETAFRATFEADGRMCEQNIFKSVSNSARVAVTTTVTAVKPQPCLLSNYNAGMRDERRSYKLIRPSELKDGVSVGQAARATSAAPWLFAPVNIPGVGMCQDGGLHHNNPILLADWEARAMWPDRGLRDFELSIGTGFSEGVKRYRPGFVRRLADSIMHNMDGEKIHEEYMNSRSIRERARIKRVNIDLGFSEPMLHDVYAMAALEEKTEHQLRTGSCLQDVHDLAIASMFCFELDSMPVREVTSTGTSAWKCNGRVFCRLQMPLSGRRRLFEELRSTNSYFLVSELGAQSYNEEALKETLEPPTLGQPHACIGSETKYAMPYRRLLSFHMKSLENLISITITGITKQPYGISGLPMSASTLMRRQGLLAPFGRSDYGITKPLPLPPSPVVPKKRRRCGMS